MFKLTEIFVAVNSLLALGLQPSLLQIVFTKHLSLHWSCWWDYHIALRLCQNVANLSVNFFSFIRQSKDSIVQSVACQSNLGGNVIIMYTSHFSGVLIQSNCANLRHTHFDSHQGTQPSKTVNNPRNVKLNLQVELLLCFHVWVYSYPKTAFGWICNISPYFAWPFIKLQPTKDCHV